MENRKLIIVFIAGALATALVFFLFSKMFSGRSSTAVQPGMEESAMPPAPDYSTQIAQLKKLLETNPNDVETLVQLGNLNYDSYQAQGGTGFCADSILFYERALALKPGNPNVLTDLGYMYRCNNQFDEAIKRFREAIRLDPRHPQSRMNLAIILYYDLHDPVGAKAAAEELVKINPDDQHLQNAHQLIAEIQKNMETKKNLPKD